MSPTEVFPPTAPARPSRAREVRRHVLIGVAAFIVGAAVLLAVAPSLAPEIPPQPKFPIQETARPHPSGDGSFTATLDIRDAEHWVPFDLVAGRLSPSEEDAHLVLRRHHLRAPQGALDLGEIAFETASLPIRPTWTRDEKISGVVQNPELEDWYDYGYWTHVLAPHPHVYAVRTTAGSAALVLLESYYCDPEGSGCLTLRWRLVDVQR